MSKKKRPAKDSPKPKTSTDGIEDIVGTEKAAELLDVRRPYVVELINAGKLKATRLSQRVYAIHRDEIRRYLREQRQWRMGGPRNDGTDARSQGG